jgi:dipeptidyl aminopeptidase/acylaminoacyl peptidase
VRSQVAVESASSEKAQNLISHPNSVYEAQAPLALTTETPAEWTLSGVFSHGVGRPRWVKGRITTESNLQAKHTPKMVNELFIADTKRKKIQQLTTDQAVYFNPEWSPDGREIVCASSEGRSLAGYAPGTTNIYIIDIATGRKRAVTTGSGVKRLPNWSPDGKWVAYLGREQYDIQSVFMVQRTGGKPSNVTSSLDRHVWDSYWSPDGKSIVVSFADGVSTHFARVGLPIGGIEKVTGEGAAFRWSATVSRSGALAWQQSDASSMSVMYIQSPGVSSPQILWDLNPQVRGWELGEQEVVRWKNHRGDKLEGILIKPVGYQEGHTYPLIVDCYTSVQNGFFGYPMTSNQELASRGYVIFYPNARSPITWINPFKTRAFAQVAKGPKGWDVTADDVLSGVNELIRRGLVDPDRMGLYGFSVGGGIVNYLVTKTNRFKCAVSVGAVLLDWSRVVFLSIFSPQILAVAGVSPWEDPEGHIQLSPIYRVNNVTTPMLLAVGDNDIEGLLNAIEMYNSLRWFGRDVTLLRYPDQGHSLKGAARKDFWEREKAFFDKYLKLGEPPRQVRD